MSMDNRQIDKDLRKAASVIRLKGLDVAEMLEEIQDEVESTSRHDAEQAIGEDGLIHTEK